MIGSMWIDTHCHLDAAEFEPDRLAVAQRARSAGVLRMVLPAVEPDNFDAVRHLAQVHDAAYALGIHPLRVARAPEEWLDRLQAALARHRDDPRLVAVGEIGLDHFVPGLDRDVQERFYMAQLRLARDAGLPVILHVRRSADALLKGLRRIEVPGGTAHAFNGSLDQALRFTARGFKLGFGGAMTFERALQIRALAVALPDDALVLETDAPDIPPQWLYRTASERRAGATARNEPCEVPRIGAVLAALRHRSDAEVRDLTAENARVALPRLRGLDAPGPRSTRPTQSIDLEADLPAEPPPSTSQNPRA